MKEVKLTFAVNSAALHNGCRQICTHGLVWHKQLLVHFSFNVLEIIIALHRSSSPTPDTHSHTQHVHWSLLTLVKPAEGHEHTAKDEALEVGRLALLHSQTREQDVRSQYFWISNDNDFKKKYFILQRNYSDRGFYASILLYNAGHFYCLIYCLRFHALHSRIQGYSHGVFRGHGFGSLLRALHHPCFFYKPVSVHHRALNLGHIELGEGTAYFNAQNNSCVQCRLRRVKLIKNAILESCPSANKFKCCVIRGHVKPAVKTSSNQCRFTCLILINKHTLLLQSEKI